MNNNNYPYIILTIKNNCLNTYIDIFFLNNTFLEYFNNIAGKMKLFFDLFIEEYEYDKYINLIKKISLC